MKKYVIIAGLLGIASMQAQENLVTQYPEELYQYHDNANLGGTARSQAMSGAMGALGGDLSATQVNPAGAAVFLGSEGVITGGVNMSKFEPNGGSSSDDSQINLDQIGAVFVFEDLNSADWRNVAMTINYQQKNTVNEAVRTSPNAVATNGNTLLNHYSERLGNSSITNFNVAANYKDKLFIGGGFNFHSFDTNNLETALVNDVTFERDYTYVKDYAPNSRTGAGLSASLGVIGKVNQNLRLGLAYQSPTWYAENEEVVTEYAMYSGTNDDEEVYYIDREVKAYINDLTTAQKFTGSAAIVLGKNGLISADYTYTDYSPAKYKPEDAFANENAFIENNMNGTSTLRVGAEMRLNDFRLRGGYRYEQTPFEEVDIFGNGEKYQPFGDLTGFSIGAGYEFNNFFIDAAYNMFTRDRDYLVSGNFYDYNGSIAADGITQEEALNYLSFNAEGSGVSQIIQDVEERQGNISLSLGFRF